MKIFFAHFGELNFFDLLEDCSLKEGHHYYCLRRALPWDHPQQGPVYEDESTPAIENLARLVEETFNLMANPDFFS